MKSTINDITNQVAENGSYTMDVSLWKNITIQLVNPSGTFDIEGTNDGNAILGAGDGNAESAINFTAIQAIDLATGSATTSAGTAGLYKVEVFCKYIRIGGGTADKIIVFKNAPF